MILSEVPEIKPGTLIRTKKRFHFKERTIFAGEVIMYIETKLKEIQELSLNAHIFLAADGRKLTYLTQIEIEKFILYNMRHQNFEMPTQ